MFDLIVTGGKAVMPSGGAELADIGVSGGKIAAVGGPGSLGDIGALHAQEDLAFLNCIAQARAYFDNATGGQRDHRNGAGNIRTY